jgi:DNA-binding response OmpR family regulator
MSYPFELQVLIIEDDPSLKSYYDAALGSLAGRGFNLAPPRYAFCHADGVHALAAERIYHLVILDLRLPKAPGNRRLKALTSVSTSSKFA